jgi:hypothetical protein
MIEEYKTMDEYLKECPDWIVEKAVSYLKTLFTEGVKEDVARLHKQDHENWWASSHFTWGMKIRSFLRENVCLDDKLPSGNWDDYYIQLVEIACGIRNKS